jgi:type VI secretion system secreted protein Hcp
MKRMIGLTLAAALAMTGLTACMSDDNGSASNERRVAALGVEGQPSAAEEYQLVIDGLTPLGEAIQVESFSWGATNPSSFGSAGATTGKVSLKDLHFTKKLDKASPLLYKGIATGTIHKTATLKLYKTSAAGGKPQVYMTYEMSNVLISSLQQGGGGGVPNEEVGLAYSKMTHISTELDEKSGAPGPAVKFGWDIVANRQA